MNKSCVLVMTLVASFSGHARYQDPISFEDRVHAQEAIDRFYRRHQMVTSPRTDATASRDFAESAVRRYLGETIALERLWGVRVTADALEAELTRIERDTRLPERLQEVYDILGNDRAVLTECFARPTLVDRLAREHFNFDPRFHEGSLREATTLRGFLQERGVAAFESDRRRRDVEIRIYDVGADVPEVASDEVRVSSEGFARLRAQLPADTGEIGPVLEERDRYRIHVITAQTENRLRVASFSVEKESWESWWSTASRAFETASSDGVVAHKDIAAHPQANASREFAVDSAPLGRSRHTAVWTGDLMIVWGGTTNSSKLNDGGVYDASTDVWGATSTAEAPTPRQEHTAVWTGTLMIVWGGADAFGTLATGGRYDPLTDSWTAISTAGAPSARNRHAAVWTGTEMIVWGGRETLFPTNTGGRYEPATDTWKPTSLTEAPEARDDHTAVWTGSRMIVWGGSFASGGEYDPVLDRWKPVAKRRAPQARHASSAIWTGSEMIVWGGLGSGGGALKTGGRYDPSSNRWTPTAVSSAPSKRSDHVAVWTGSRMVVWGGQNSRGVKNTGGVYDPLTDTWTATSLLSAPPGAKNSTAVWTGDLMIVWGGDGDSQPQNTGGRYDPTADSWMPTSTVEGVDNGE